MFTEPQEKGLSILFVLNFFFFFFVLGLAVATVLQMIK